MVYYDVISGDRCCYGNVMDLTEVSLDDNLHDNSVSMVMTHNILPSSVAVQKSDDVVMITFTTMANIHVLELPHPLTVTKVMHCRCLL